MISLGWCNIEMLLQATNDVAQRALTRFRRGCARITTGHLPDGANAIVVIRNDRDVHGGLRTAGPRATQPKPRPRAPFLSSAASRVSSSATRRSWSPFFEIAMRQRLNAGAFFAHSVRDSTSAERAAQERVRSKLRTWAAAPDGAQAPAVWAWGSGLRAAPVSWRPCARVGWLLPARGSCARTVFHTPCGASFREKRPRVASSF